MRSGTLYRFQSHRPWLFYPTVPLFENRSTISLQRMVDLWLITCMQPQPNFFAKPSTSSRSNTTQMPPRDAVTLWSVKI